MRFSFSTLTLLSACACPLLLQGQVFLIDFNDTANANGYPGGASAWNAYDDPSDVTGASIQDSTGSSALGVTLSYSGTMTNSNNGNANTFNNASGGPSWVTTDGSLNNTAAAADYFFTSINADTDFTVTLGNLNEGDTVNLDLWMSRVSSSGSLGFYEYSLDGGSTWSGFNVLNKDGTPATARSWDTNTTQSQTFLAEIDGNDNARYMNVGALTVGELGTVDVRVNDTSSGNWAGLGAMRMTLTPVPEPATYAMLLSIAVLGIVYVRRRQRR